MARLTWRVRPSVVADAVIRYGERIRFGTVGSMNRQADRALMAMQANAPWEDQTGNARARLYVRVTEDGDRITIILGHGVYYGIFLELKNGGAYAIVLPTMRAMGPAVIADLQGMLS